MKTIKVKPWGEGQGDHVIINESDFNEDFHQLLGGKEPSVKSTPSKPKRKATTAKK